MNTDGIFFYNMITPTRLCVKTKILRLSLYFFEPKITKIHTYGFQYPVLRLFATNDAILLYYIILLYAIIPKDILT